MNECILSTAPTDALVLKQQAIIIYSADKINIHCFEPKYYIYS